MKLKEGKEIPMIRVVLYDLRDGSDGKSMTATFYKNGYNPSLKEAMEKIKGALTRGGHDE